MSGGRWNYGQCNLGYEMYPGCDVCYGLGDGKYGTYSESVKLARKLDPMEDKMLSELVYDILCLIYSADWYKSGDTGEESYRKDIKYFKQKWLKPAGKDLIKSEIEKATTALRNELMYNLCYEGGFEEVEDESV